MNDDLLLDKSVLILSGVISEIFWKYLLSFEVMQVYSLKHKFTSESTLYNETRFSPITSFDKNDSSTSIKNRLLIDNNSVKFSYQGSDLELRLLNNNIEGGNEEKSVIIKVLNNNTTLYYNQKMFFNRPTPHLLLNNKYQQYEIIVENNMLKLVVENKFTLLNVEIPEKDFTFSEVEIKSESDGSWIV